LLLTATLVIAAVGGGDGQSGARRAKDAPAAAKDWDASGLLPRDHLTTESAIQVI